MARLVAGLLALAVVAYGVTTLPGVRDRPGFDPLYDGWLLVSGYVLAAVLVALRPLRHAYQRDMWTLLAVSLALRAGGFLLDVGYVRSQVPPPYPSVADAAWLA